MTVYLLHCRRACSIDALDMVESAESMGMKNYVEVSTVGPALRSLLGFCRGFLKAK